VTFLGKHAIKEFYDLEDIQLNYQAETGLVNSSWGNLGYWIDEHQQAISTYPLACTQLAVELGQLAKLDQLFNHHRVLDTGFGCGDQLLVWQTLFAVNNLIGINYSHAQTAHAQSLLAQTRFSLKQGDCCDPLAWQGIPKTLDRILALDCLYHFHNKPSYFSICRKHLASDGILAVSDLILVKPISNPVHKWMLKIICSLSHIPFKNLMTLPDYQSSLARQGLFLSQSRDISDQVFLPFGNWLECYIEQMQKHNKADRKLRWLKYRATGVFLRWAHNRQILSYQLLKIVKAAQYSDNTLI
jgi:cyclopropane fatty-acyl-phospholipid synthase-like methyltransferase